MSLGYWITTRSDAIEVEKAGVMATAFTLGQYRSLALPALPALLQALDIRAIDPQALTNTTLSTTNATPAVAPPSP